MRLEIFNLQLFAKIKNYDNDTIITGTTAGDTIENRGNNNAIYGVGGNDSVVSYGGHVTIYGEAGKDTIRNNDSVIGFSVIYGGDDKDSIYNDGRNSTVYGGDGDDRIVNNGINSTIFGEGGNDTIYSSYFTSNNALYGGDGNDSISYSGSNNTISGGKGDDIIVKFTSQVINNVILYSEGDGNDTISCSSSDTLQIESGTISSIYADQFGDVIVEVGSGRVTLRDKADKLINIVDSGGNLISQTYTYEGEEAATIIANDGSKKLKNFTDGVEISASNGQDRIVNEASHVTIYGYAGADSIVNGSTQKSGFDASFAWIDGGDDNDVIHLYGMAANNNTIYGGAGNDSIWNNSSIAAIYGGVGDDSIANNGNNGTVYGGDGDDTIINSSRGSDTAIYGGNGNDSIYNGSVNCEISGGDGDDTITIMTRYNTIAGNAGADFISLHTSFSGQLIQYADGDGKDTVYGLSDSDTLQVTSGVISNVYADSLDNVIVEVGSGSITLLNQVRKVVNLIDSSGALTTQTYGDSISTIKNVIGENVVYGSASTDSVYNDSIANSSVIHLGDGNDTVVNCAADVTVFGGNGKDNITNTFDYSIVYNSVSDSVDYSDSGGTIRSYYDLSTIYGGELTYGGNDNDTVINRKSNSTIYGGAGNDSISNWGGTTSILGGDGADFIINSNYVSVKTYSWSGSSTIPTGYTVTGSGFCTIDGGDGDDTIDSSGHGNVIFSGSGDDSIRFSGFNNTVYAGKGNDIIDLFTIKIKGVILSTSAYEYGYAENSVILYANGDGDDTISFYNSYKDSNEIRIYADSYSTMTSGNDFIIRVGDGSITIPKGATLSPHITLVEGELNLSSELEKSNGRYSYTGGNKFISNYQSSEVVDFGASYTSWRVDGNKIFLNADEGSLQIDNATNKWVKVAAGGNVIAQAFVSENYEGALDGRGLNEFEVIVGSNSHANQIYAGAGGSSLWGGAGNSNDELFGGEGYDEFIYNFGNGQDKIFNAGSNDVVNLNGIALDQFISVDVNESAVSATFADGGSLRIEGNSGVGYKLGNKIYSVNQSTNEWYTK